MKKRLAVFGLLAVLQVSANPAPVNRSKSVEDVVVPQPLPEKLSTPQASTLEYVSPRKRIFGVAHGLMALDSRPLVLRERLFVIVNPGDHTVWYACPSSTSPQGKQIQDKSLSDKKNSSKPLKEKQIDPFYRGPYSSIKYRFEEGQMYELVCVPGKSAVIRKKQAGC